MALPNDQNPPRKPVQPPPAGNKPPQPGAPGGNKRKIGQVMIDLGFIDEDQLWEVLEDAKNTAQLTGQAAVARGLINSDQLLQALGEQHGLKLVNLVETKPSQDALTLVPE